MNCDVRPPVQLVISFLVRASVVKAFLPLQMSRSSLLFSPLLFSFFFCFPAGDLYFLPFYSFYFRQDLELCTALFSLPLSFSGANSFSIFSGRTFPTHRTSVSRTVYSVPRFPPRFPSLEVALFPLSLCPRSHLLFLQPNLLLSLNFP